MAPFLSTNPPPRPARAVRRAALAAFLLASTAAAAEVVETTVRVPVSLDAADGQRLSREIVLTVVRDAARARGPFAVLLHGRPEDAGKFAAMDQQKYPANARYLAHLGFVVLVPTRVGYGATGGPDVEYTGECDSKNPMAGMAPLVSEVRQVLRYAAGLAYVDAGRGIVMGESFGGVGAVAVAASDIPGVVGVVNIAGGDGGSLAHLEEPCRPDRLGEAFADYGRRNRVPALWMYSRNDRFWGTRYPLAWFDAFSRAGGRGRFEWLPADKNNGHYIFNRNAPAWHGPFEAFLRQIGLTTVQSSASTQ